MNGRHGAVGQIATVPKIGSGTDEDEFRPDTTAAKWRVVEERPTEFVIEVLE